MAYIPNHEADVFISFSHQDDFLWVERFKQDLETILVRKLRSRTRPVVFLDAHALRAGRLFDKDIPACLAQTGFFVALVSHKYNASTYCKHKELAAFLDHATPDSGRVVQVRLDPSSDLPLANALAVEFADPKRIFRAGSDEYDDALRRVYEPIVFELDRLYAASKMIFLAWPREFALQQERERLEAEIESRGFRVFPEQIGRYEVDSKLRPALERSVTSVHFFAGTPDDFAVQQWEAALRLGRPCVIASTDKAEARRGPPGSPHPVYLEQGDPIKLITNEIEDLLGRGRRHDRDPQQMLGKMPVLLAYHPDTDSTLGLRVRQRILNRGPFEVIEPRRAGSDRYDELSRAKGALLCRAKADGSWVERESEALHAAIGTAQLYKVQRAYLLVPPNGRDGVDFIDDDRILQSIDDLDAFLMDLQGMPA